MVGVGRDLCGSSSPTLLPKQGHPQQAAEDLVQVGPEHLQRRRPHNVPGQPAPGLLHPQSEEAPPHTQMEPPVPQSVPTAPCPQSRHAMFRGCDGLMLPKYRGATLLLWSQMHVTTKHFVSSLIPNLLWSCLTLLLVPLFSSNSPFPPYQNVVWSCSVLGICGPWEGKK